MLSLLLYYLRYSELFPNLELALKFGSRTICLIYLLKIAVAFLLFCGTVLLCPWVPTRCVL